MDNIFYKLFYMIYHMTPEAKDNDFPILTIGILSQMLLLNFISLFGFFMFFFTKKNSLNIPYLIVSLILYLILFLFFTIKFRYNKIYKYYKKEKFEKKSVNIIIFGVYALFTIVLLVILGLIRFIYLK